MACSPAVMSAVLTPSDAGDAGAVVVNVHVVLVTLAATVCRAVNAPLTATHFVVVSVTTVNVSAAPDLAYTVPFTVAVPAPPENAGGEVVLIEVACAAGTEARSPAATRAESVTIRKRRRLRAEPIPLAATTDVPMQSAACDRTAPHCLIANTLPPFRARLDFSAALLLSTSRRCVDGDSRYGWGGSTNGAMKCLIASVARFRRPRPLAVHPHLGGYGEAVGRVADGKPMYCSQRSTVALVRQCRCKPLPA